MRQTVDLVCEGVCSPNLKAIDGYVRTWRDTRMGRMVYRVVSDENVMPAIPPTLAANLREVSTRTPHVMVGHDTARCSACGHVRVYGCSPGGESERRALAAA